VTCRRSGTLLLCVSQTEGTEGIALRCSVAAAAPLPGHLGSIPAAGMH